MRLSHLLLTLLACTLPVTIVAAQSGYPEPTDNYVNDFAGILSSDAEDYIRETLQAAEVRDGIEMAVVTIQSARDYDTSAQTFEAFATGLFNVWGIGDAQRGDGVLLLAAMGDRDVRVELGEHYPASANADAQDTLDENILPAFRRGDYQAGIVNGVRALVSEFTGTLPPLPPPSVSQAQPFRAPESQQAGNEGGQSAALIILVLIALGGFGLLGLLNSVNAGHSVSDGWSDDSADDTDWKDDSPTTGQYSSSSRRSSWSSSRRSSSSSSSSRGSSFGGGRSKGGGASGKW